MPTDPTCIFCKIVAGQLPSALVYEDDHSYAFMNLEQMNPGHTLLISKEHYRNIFDLPEELAAQLGPVSVRLSKAIKTAFKPQGLNVLQNNEPAAMQSVFHYHMHLIPRYFGDDLLEIWGSGASSIEERQTNATKIRAALETSA